MTRIDVEKIVHSESNIAPVAFLRIKEATLNISAERSFKISSPPLLESSFAEVQHTISASQENYELVESDTLDSEIISAIEDPLIVSQRIGAWVTVTNVSARVQGRNHDYTIEEEVLACFKLLRGKQMMLVTAFPNLSRR